VSLRFFEVVNLCFFGAYFKFFSADIKNSCLENLPRCAKNIR